MATGPGQAQSFDAIAELYDEIRPEYPDELIADIAGATGIPHDARILEVGCGTGKASLPFAERGYGLTCLEPGEALGRIASTNLAPFPNARVEASTFEAWDGQTGFDLIASAQAFHWIPPEMGYPKCADLLRDGGWIAMFWNMVENYDAPIFQELNELYKAIAPGLTDHIDKTDEARERGLQEGVEEIDACGRFGPVTVQRYRWDEDYSTERYLRLLKTFSDHRALRPSLLGELLDGVRRVIEQHGGTISKPYLSVLYLARKSGEGP